MYTYNQLKRCKKSQLLELVRYHRLGEVSKRMKKGDIIDYILEKIHIDDRSGDVFVNEPPMSARIKRLKELNR